MTKTIIIFVLSLTPSLVYWWLRRRAESQWVQEFDLSGRSIVSPRWQMRYFPPDTRYVEGVGFLIGDITCKYNARSSQIRCAVNPQGPCQDCPSYEMKED
ncbi:MAG: hypothetical protein HC835_07005 [Oscillatoriales cyanobacterium RM2_1_1]|nr:hypothetical protein [Oscillatoriales cyanobacterium SM2_3_0]NJO45390.1 hypothetical protein [Oscillatoriales cyanobacterium RM2_1_1]